VGLHAVGSPTCTCPDDLPEPIAQPEATKPEFQAGDTLVLRNLHFAYDKADILPTSFPQLDSLADFLLHHQHLKIRITGHTDSDGEGSYNLKLSKNRAAAVLSYLVTQQVAVTRMQSTGRGEELPAVPNDSEASKALNRRVEVEFLGE
jgi:OmpA-OmpF porin, OOP family